jgi:AraC-like DNA-binding protein
MPQSTVYIILRLLIKNIISLHSLQFVKSELERLGIHGISIEPAEITTSGELTSFQYDRLRFVLEQAGVELFTDKKDALIQRIKGLIMEIVYNTKEAPVYNLSTYLSEKLQHDYTYMSNLFSDRLHTTIEKFYICHKIERAKELLVYEGMTLTEIAYKMHYSSVAHLSSQFKRVAGVTPSQYKRLHEDKKLPPEDC